MGSGGVQPLATTHSDETALSAADDLVTGIEPPAQKFYGGLATL